MVKFSCFSTPSLSQRPKKVQHLGTSMHSPSQQKSVDQERELYFGSARKIPNVVDSNHSNSSVEQTASPPSSHGDFWKSELNGDFMEGNQGILLKNSIKKSRSLGNILEEERGFSSGDIVDGGELDRKFSFNSFHEKSLERINGSLDGDTSLELYNHEKDFNFENQLKGNHLVHSLFSIEVLKGFDGNQHADVDDQSTDLVEDNHSAISRSHSVSNLRVNSHNHIGGTKTNRARPRSRSFGNLHTLNGEMEGFHGDEDISPNLPPDSDEDRKCSDTSGGLLEGQEVHEKYWNERYDCSDDHIASGNENTEIETEDEKMKKLKAKSPIQNCDDLNPKEFTIRRIKEWISQIDTENENIVEETGESSNTFSTQEPHSEVSVPDFKIDAKSNLGMEVAHNYILSLTATSTSAQMVNLGLVAVPFLSAFSSLRVLNLSGNSIVRITPGSLPRGLHMLNLSKNNIAIIEGLRDQTRLRVLDLSYNRIVRIGHGLASCSSLKELYLAGNKISDIEGLHRLFKLNTLDLRSNKISTAKGISQLAANYASLQAINLEGNPAQRNVGDEQLKKHLLSLLPNLVYYNKQAMKASGAKEIPDRTSRSFKKTDNSLTRRGSHGSGLHKLALNHVRSSHDVGSLLKRSSHDVGSRGRNLESRYSRLLPPIGSKPVNYLPEMERKPVSLKPSNPIRRSQSEGTL